LAKQNQFGMQELILFGQLVQGMFSLAYLRRDGRPRISLRSMLQFRLPKLPLFIVTAVCCQSRVPN